MIRNRPGGLNTRGVATAKGLEMYGEHIQAVRDAIGWEQPLAADHFGPLDVNDAIRHARFFEQYELAWAEDLLQVGTLGSGDAPRNWRAYKEIKESTTTPINTGESLFGLEEGFRPLIENNAVDIIHPDPLTSGAIRETKRISDFASMYGIPTAVHFAGSPVGCMAAVHMISTLKDFLAMENHAVDIPWWGDLVTGPAKPIIQDGYIQVPDYPGNRRRTQRRSLQGAPSGAGVLRADAPVRQVHRRRIPDGGPYPHLDENGKLVNTARLGRHYAHVID